MLGIGELLLILVVLLLGGGIVSRLAKWVLLRRAPGASRVLGVLSDLVKTQREAQPPTSATETERSSAPEDDGSVTIHRRPPATTRHQGRGDDA